VTSSTDGRVPAEFPPAHAARWACELLDFLNLAGYGIHIDFIGFLAIHDFNLVDDAAVIFPIFTSTGLPGFSCSPAVEHPSSSIGRRPTTVWSKQLTLRNEEVATALEVWAFEGPARGTRIWKIRRFRTAKSWSVCQLLSGSSSSLRSP
jgi:hypothetical protein